jgi:benzil reductase ((S)-benzoin forming)
MKTYIITGSSKGLGKELCLQLLSRNDCKVFGLSRTSSFAHSNFQHFEIDLSFPEQLQAILPNLRNALNDSSELLLINNAAQVGEIKEVGNLSSTDITKTINLNLTVPIMLTNYLVHYCFEKQIDLKIFNIGSGTAKNAISGWSLYCSTKSGLKMFSDTLRKESSSRTSKVTVAYLDPGLIDTEMQTFIRSKTSEDFKDSERFKQFKADNLLNSPEFIAQKIVKCLHDSQLQNQEYIRLVDTD